MEVLMQAIYRPGSLEVSASDCHHSPRKENRYSNHWTGIAVGRLGLMWLNRLV